MASTRACTRPPGQQLQRRVMREAVRAKFTQHEKLTELLLTTGDAELIEHTANDNYWADGGDGTGLMAFRSSTGPQTGPVHGWSQCDAAGRWRSGAT